MPTLPAFELIVTVAAAVLAICGTIFVWGVKLERRFAACLTAEQHDTICTENQRLIHEELRSLRAAIDANEQRAANTRHDIRDTVHALQTAVELLKAQAQWNRKDSGR